MKLLQWKMVNIIHILALKKHQTFIMKELTTLQWAKHGYVPNTDAKGIERWTNCYHSVKATYYNENEVHVDFESAKSILQAKRREYREEAKKRKQRLVNFEIYRENMKTEWQWLQEGRIPNPNARWKNGESLNNTFKTCSFGSHYCYCNIDETRKASSSEELQIAINEYNKKFT